MKKVVRLTEADLINLIKGTINELEHDAEGYAKYVKREDYLNATSILVQNELIDNGLDVYAEEHGHNLGVEGFNESSPDRELNIKLIIIEFETFYDDDYELSSDMTDMKLKIYHIGNNVPTFATYNLLDGIDLLIDLKNKGLLPSTNNETINESFDSLAFGDHDFIEALSIEVQNVLANNDLNILDGATEKFPGRLWVVGHVVPLPDHPVTISAIQMDFDLSSLYDHSGPYLDIIIYFHGVENNVVNKSLTIAKGIDFILKLKEEGKLPSRDNETINESFSNHDFIEALSTEVQNELTENGLKVYFLDPAYVTTFPGRLWVVGHEAPLPDHPLTISEIRIDFDLSPYNDDSGPYLDMRIYFHGAGNHEADKSFKIEKGIDFILKLKEEGKLPEGKRPTLNYDNEEW